MIVSLFLIGIALCTLFVYFAVLQMRAQQLNQADSRINISGEQLLTRLIAYCHSQNISLEATTLVSGYNDQTRTLHYNPNTLRRQSMLSVANAGYLMALVLFSDKLPKLYARYGELEHRAALAEKAYVGLLAIMPLLIPALRVPQALIALLFLTFIAYLTAIALRFWQIPIERRILQDIAEPLIMQEHQIDPTLKHTLNKALVSVEKNKLASTITLLFNIRQWIAVLRR